MKIFENPTFRVNVADPTRLRTESSLPEFSRRYPPLPAATRGYPPLPAATRGNGVRNCCSDPTSTRAGGQDDVS